jgi:YD repeat-containing protein
MSEENNSAEELDPQEESVQEEVASQEEVKREKKVKPELKQFKKQIVYRLPNGEWDDFEKSDTIDKTDFYKVFERELTKDGELVEEKEFDRDGSEIQKTVNTFNDNGKIIHHELFNEGELVEKMHFDYDEKNRLIKETREFDEGFPLTTTFKYDDEDRMIEKRIDDSDGELQKRETFSYHSTWKDKVVKHEIFDEEDKISIEEENEWEERDGEIKQKKIIAKDHSLDSYRRTELFDPKIREDKIAYAVYNEKEKVVEYVKVIFDDEGRELEEHSISVNDSDNFKVYYTYDDLDRVIKQEQHQLDKIISKINRRFGESGYAELIAVRSFSRGMYVDYFEYEFYPDAK